MSKYLGLRAIARRMGWKSYRTPPYHLEYNSFLMYRVRLSSTAYKWETNDDLIFAWELERARKSRAEYLGGIRQPYREPKREKRNVTMSPGMDNQAEQKAGNGAAAPQEQVALLPRLYQITKHETRKKIA
ncbi:MAG: hypothetical protein ACM3TN_17555 [Alphaproteobacteria bacterium]